MLEADPEIYTVMQCRKYVVQPTKMQMEAVKKISERDTSQLYMTHLF